MSTSVKHIHNGMRGAPTINGTAGTLIAALDALFTTGWGVTTAVSVTVSGGIATATLTSGETFDRDAVVLIAGATPGALNGEARVLTTSLTSITWATAAADGVATGTITIKYAPQTSWVKGFAGTNKAKYHSTHAQSRGHSLRIDDTGTTAARVRGYESMTDVDTGTGPFPTDAHMSGGGYWWKSGAANATAVKWRMFCDERFLIVAIAAGSYASALFSSAPARGFGDPIELAPGGDVWCTLLSATGSSMNNATPGALSGGISNDASGITAVPRSITGLGGAVLQINKTFTGANASGNDTTALGAFPSTVDGQAKTSLVFTRESAANSPPRAIVPGVHYIPQSGAYGPLADGDILSGAGPLAGRKLMVVAEIQNMNSTPSGCYLVDITGPWR